MVSIPFRWGLLPESRTKISVTLRPFGSLSQSPFVGVSFQSPVEGLPLPPGCLHPSQSPFVGVSFQSPDMHGMPSRHAVLVGLNPLSLGSPSRATEAFIASVGPFLLSLNPLSLGSPSRVRHVIDRCLALPTLCLNPLSLGSPSRGGEDMYLAAFITDHSVSIPFRWGLLPEDRPGDQESRQCSRLSQSPFVGVSFQSRWWPLILSCPACGRSQSPFVGVSFQSGVAG